MTTISDYATCQTAQECFDKGDELIDKKQYKLAIENFTKAIKINPQYAEAYSRRASIVQDYDTDGAMDDYNKAIEIEPKYAVTYYLRGELKSFVKDFKGAIVDFTKAIHLNVKAIDVYYNRGGTAKMALKDYRGAIEDFTKAVELNSEDSDAFMNRGMARIAIGQKEIGCLDLSKLGELGYSEAYRAIKEFCN